MFEVTKKNNKTYVKLNADTANIGPLAELVEEFGKKFLSDEDAYNMAVSVDEAVTNIILHAYKDNNQGEIFVQVFDNEDEVGIQIEDYSEKFIPPVMVEKKKFTFDKLEEGGLGLYLMQEFMDELRFLYDEHEKKNIILMKKYLI